MDQELKRALLPPVLTLIALLGLLLLDSLLGYFFIAGHIWILEVFVSIAMVAVVLVMSMEGRTDPALMRLFTGIGFFWLCILVGLSMVDYTTR